jgi:hypothetical protein
MFWRIKANKAKVFRVVSVVGSFASVLGITVPFLIATSGFSWWAIVLLTVGSLLLVGAVVLELQAESNIHLYKIEDQQGIRNYMFNWIRNGGRVAIWTRDMSWVDDQMRQLLNTKAENGELIICLPRHRGAEVVAYGRLESPSSRFTIIDYNWSGSRVAVGRRRGSLHVIEEFSADDHPAFHMALDLVRLVRGEPGDTHES